MSRPERISYDELLTLLKEANDAQERLLDCLENDRLRFAAYKKRSEACLRLKDEWIKKLERRIAELEKPITPAKIVTLRVLKSDKTPG